MALSNGSSRHLTHLKLASLTASHQDQFMFEPTPPPRTQRVNRRSFLQATAVASLGSMFSGQFDSLAAEAGPGAAELNSTGSDVGSLFPFVQSQAVKGEFPLSFLNPRFRSLRNWKKI